MKHATVLATVLATLTVLGPVALSACQPDTPPPASRQVPVVELTPFQQTAYDAAWATVNGFDFGADPDGMMAAIDSLETLAVDLYPDGHPEFQRIALQRVGALFTTGKLTDAESLLLAARAELDGLEGYEVEWISATGDLAVIYNSQGRHAEAAPLFADALAYRLENTTGFPDQEVGVAYNNMAASDFEFADFESALRNNAEAIRIADALDPAYPQSALWYANRPVYLRRAGRGDEALIAARKAAVDVARVLPENHPYNGNILNNLALLSLEAGRLAEADGAARRALDLVAAATGPDSLQTGAMQVGLANVKLAEGDPETARTLYQSALKTFEAGGAQASNRAFTTRSNINRADFLSGRTEAAIAAQQALVAEMAEALPSQSSERAESRLGLAQMQVRAGNADAAQSLATELVEGLSATRLADDPELLLARSISALAQARLGEADAVPSGRAVLDGIALRRRLDSVSKASTAGQSSTLSEALGNVVLTGLESGNDALAFAALQMLGDDGTALAQRKARQRDALSGSAATAFSDLQNRVEMLDAKRNAYLMGLGKGEADASLYAEVEALRSEVEAALEGAADIGVAPVALADFQASLRDGEWVLFGRSFGPDYRMIALSRDALHAHAVPAGELRSAVAGLRAELERGIGDPSTPFDRTKAQAVYALLASGDLAAPLADASHFKLKLAGILDRIPLSVLHDGTDYLADRASLSMLTDLTRTADSGAAAMSPEPRYIGVSYSPKSHGDVNADGASSGSPVLAFRSALGLQTDYAPLPNAAAEIARIGDALSAQSVLLSDADATEMAVRAAPLSTADLIVFASHGLTVQASPTGEPALLLQSDGDDDGYLSASEIARLPMAARLVVLSACDTAGAQQAGGQAYSGLTRAFFLSGAQSVMVSHWPVRDDAAAFLTTRTVEAMADGLPGPDALSAAMRALKASSLDNADHPAVWGPFVIVGQ